VFNAAAAARSLVAARLRADRGVETKDKLFSRVATVHSSYGTLVRSFALYYALPLYVMIVTS